MKIIKAWVNDIEKIYWIVKNCSNKLKSEWYNHWERYKKETITSKFNSDKENYLLVIEDKKIWFFSIHFSPQKFYTENDNKFWYDSEWNALYFSTLCILPEFQWKWYLSFILDFIKEKSIKYGIKYIRITYLSDIKKLKSIYTKKWFNVVNNRFIEEVDNYVDFAELVVN